MLQFDAIGMFALAALAMCWALAVVLYRVGATGSVARKLSLLLVVEGATLISTGYLDLFLTESARALPFYPFFYRAEEIVHTVGVAGVLPGTAAAAG